MPRKSKKSTETQAAEPANATELTKDSTESALDAEVQAPAPPSLAAEASADVELNAHAADTFDDAFEEKPAAAPRRRSVKGRSKAAAKQGAEPVASAEPEPEIAEEAQHGESDEEAIERPPAKLERLQKILAQAGVASRRHAEELIAEGHVQVNGKVVTELGSKADPTRDHIRVDGKLLQGAERLRYFVLNKPRGYVTTVSDPEGRPTVMEFFSKMGERLYPVGRLDFQSEGLLVVTNDGELANKLTRAASGVEKTYLVKVSGYPSEEQLETLREGVNIDRNRPGEGRVRTAPANIRMVRSGENPWFEVVLIEGRNRELRKMFEEIGHHVEKIRRVGYGPLVLDVEPGKMRELEPEELEVLRKAADGKWKPKRVKFAAMLPKEAGRSVDHDAGRGRGERPFKPRFDRGEGQRRGPQGRPAGRGREEQGRGTNRGFGRGERPAYGRPEGRTAERGGFQRPPQGQERGERRGFARPQGEDQRGANRRSFGRPQQGEQRGARPGFGRPPQGEQRGPRPGYGQVRENEDRGERRGFGRGQQGRTDAGARRFGAGPRPGFGADREQRGEGRRPVRNREEGGGEETRRFGAGRSAPAQGQRPFRGRPQGGEQERPRFDRGAAAGKRPSRLEIVEEGAERRESRPARPRAEGSAFRERPSRPRGEEREFRERPARPAGRGFGPDRGRGPREGGQRGTGGSGGFESGRRGEQRSERPRREEAPRGERAGQSRGFGGGRPPAGGRGRSAGPGRGASGGGSRGGSRGPARGGAGGGPPNRGGSRPGGGRRG